MVVVDREPADAVPKQLLWPCAGPACQAPAPSWRAFRKVSVTHRMHASPSICYIPATFADVCS